MAQLINGPKKYKQFIKSSVSDVQDPVFLTFDLDFFIKDTSLVQHPMGDGLYFDNLFKEFLTGEAASPYANPEMSSIEWLRLYGSSWTSENAVYLAGATQQLKLLQESQWYFQSVNGIDSLWKAATRVKEGDKKAEITINCLDSIQQPLLKFAEYYRRAIYDFDKLCYNLPDNMRTFSMAITLYEIRDIRDDLGELENGLHQLRFILHRCEFDFSDILSGSGGGSEFTAYTEDKPFSTSFKIKVGWVTEFSEQSTESDYHSLGIFAGALSSLEGRAQRFLQSAARLPGRLVGTLVNDLQASIENKVIGNVYNRVTEVGSTDVILGRNSPIGPAKNSLVGDLTYSEPQPNPTINNLGIEPGY
jgi:hypothetical protein